MVRFSLKRVAAVAALVVFAAPVLAQDYPNKPIRIIVGYAPGGIMDVYARVLQQPLQERLKVPIVIDNRIGAGGLVGANAAAKADPDGYTLTHMAMSTLSKVFVKDPSMDFNQALVPVASLWLSPYVLMIGSQVPATSAKEFVAYARANPGKLNYGGTGPLTLLSMGLFANIAGIQMQWVQYKASPQMHAAIVTNEIQATFAAVQSVLTNMSTGKVRVLMVSDNQRLPSIPNVPTAAEAGFPDVQFYAIGAIMAPAGTPNPVIAKLNPVFREVIALPEVSKHYVTGGRVLNVSNEELSRLLKEEEAIWARAAKVMGFKPE